MRLLHTGSHRLSEYFDESLPPYAILSHTWEHEEVTYQDIQSLNHASTKHGFAKIKGACDIAAAQGYEFIWIDTCCIDKSSSAELSEAINSMYLWYQRSAVCYAYLADVHFWSSARQEAVLRYHRERNGDYEAVDTIRLGTRSPSTFTTSSGPDSHWTSSPQRTFWNFNESDFRKSKWFTRGWTLQELIAPHNLTFYSHDWNELGSKGALGALISSITGIDRSILAGGDHKIVAVARKMFWASRRKTTRKEDMAYCLIGLFSVNMPLMYGEGDRAFIRLQEEIIKMHGDQSIFAWAIPQEEAELNRLYGLLAESPRAFMNTGVQVSSFPRIRRGRQAARVTNNSLETAVLVQPQRFTLGSIDDSKLKHKAVDFYRQYFPALLDCQMGNSGDSWACIDLMALDSEDGIASQEFARIDPWVLDSVSLERSVLTNRAHKAMRGVTLQASPIPFIDDWMLSLKSFWKSSTPWDLQTISVAHTPRQFLPLGFRLQLLDDKFLAVEVYPVSQWYNHDHVLQGRAFTVQTSQDFPTAFLDSKTRKVSLEKSTVDMVGYTHTEEVSRVDGVIKIQISKYWRIPSDSAFEFSSLRPCVALVLGVKQKYAPLQRIWNRSPWCRLIGITPLKELEKFDYLIDWQEDNRSELATGSMTKIQAEVEKEAEGNGLFQVKMTTASIVQSPRHGTPDSKLSSS